MVLHYQLLHKALRRNLPLQMLLTNGQYKKPVIKAAGVYSLDDSLYAEYAKILETGSLPITFENETMQEQTTSSETEIFTTIVRNVSKQNKNICFIF